MTINVPKIVSYIYVGASLETTYGCQFKTTVGVSLETRCRY